MGTRIRPPLVRLQVAVIVAALAVCIAAATPPTGRAAAASVRASPPSVHAAVSAPAGGSGGARPAVVWTGAALTAETTSAANATRARTFANWVLKTWDKKGDNIFVWDFRTLETNGGLYLLAANASAPDDPHPNVAFSRKVAPLIGRRIVDVIDGRGDKASVTGK